MKFTTGGPCNHCDRTSSPCWRKGPPEKPTLCNACGSRYLVKKSLDGYMPQAFPAGGAVQALQREAQQRQQERALQLLDLPADGRARQKRTQLPSSQQIAKQRKRSLAANQDNFPGPSPLELGGSGPYKRKRSLSYSRADQPLPRSAISNESPGRHSVSGCNTQYLPDQPQYATLPADPQPASSLVSGQLLRYFTNGKTTVDVATQTSDSWLDDDDDEGDHEEVEGAAELVITGRGIETIQAHQEGDGLEESPDPRSSSGSGERSSGPQQTVPKARRRRKPAHPVSSRLY